MQIEGTTARAVGRWRLRAVAEAASKETVKSRKALRPLLGGSVTVLASALAIAVPTAGLAQLAITYEYDPQGRLKVVNDAAGWKTTYSLDSTSNRTRVAVVKQFPTKWAASALSHQVGRSDAGGWSAKPADAEGYMIFGTSAANVSVGDHIAAYRVLVNNNTTDDLPIVVVDVFDSTSQTQIAQRSINRKEWRSANFYEVFELPFVVTSANAGHTLDFRVYYLHNAYARVDQVGYR